MPSFIAEADLTFPEAERGRLLHITFGRDGVETREFHETREERGEKTTTLIVSRERPPRGTHLVYESGGYWVYESGWSICRRIKRIIETSEERVKRARGAINPLLYIVSETDRLVLLRALRHETTEKERELYLDLLDCRERVVTGEAAGRNITACFRLCKEIVREVER